MMYLDSAAVVKLVHAEPESAALRGWLDERAETGWISSILVEIESFRALASWRSNHSGRWPDMRQTPLPACLPCWTRST